MTFGSVPLKRLGDFENGDMPELASIFAQGCSDSMDLCPTADSYTFNISPKIPIEQNLYVYYVGIQFAERGKPWGFYLSTPVCSAQ